MGRLFVMADFPGFIYRVIPVPGRLYVSTNYFCFKSTGPLASRTRVSVIYSH
jgi:sterol 3beta-glucosyltransferase